MPVPALLLLSASMLAAVGGVVWISLLREEVDTWAETVLAADRAPRWRRALRRLEVRLDRFGPARAVSRRLTTAGLPLRPARSLALVASTAVSVSLLAALLLPPPFAIFGVVAAFKGAATLLERLRRRRHAVLLAQLPDVTRTVAAVSATRSLLAAIERTSERVPEPAASVLRRVVGRTSLGWTLAEALEEMRREMPDPEIGLLVTTLIVHDASGGDAAAGLRGIADAMEARRRLKREVRTHLSGTLATVRLVALLGVAMPFGVDAISEDALKNLVGSPFGLAVSLGAIALYVTGLLLIARIGRIEV